MVNCILAAFSLLLLGVFLGPTASDAGQIYLHADFNDKTIDQPILHRGAAYGEPYEVDAEAGGFVRSTPMSTPSLEIEDGSSSVSCSARFSFLENAGIVSGLAVVTANLWFAEMPGSLQYRVYVSDHNSGSILVTLHFGGDGTVFVEDLNNNHVEVGLYEIGRVYPIAIAVDMTGHTYDVWFDGQIVRDDVPIGITDETLGEFVLAAGRDEDLDGLFYVDDIHVSDDPDAVPVDEITWGRIRGLFRR